MAGKQINMRFSEQDLSLLYVKSGYGEAIRELVHKGLQWEMRQETNKPLSLLFMATYGDIFGLYRKFQDALSTEIGLLGPLKNTCRFEEAPEGSLWAEQGQTVYLVLAENEVLAPSGDIVFSHSRETTESMPSSHAIQAGQAFIKKFSHKPETTE